MPTYSDKIVFVNALTEDGPGKRLAQQFQFQYIPTSFFLDAAGKVVDSYTGSLTEQEMRDRLDKVVAE